MSARGKPCRVEISRKVLQKGAGLAGEVEITCHTSPEARELGFQNSH